MTAVPAAIDGFLTQLRDNTDLAGVLISDGPWLTHPDRSDAVVVGWLSSETFTVEWHSAPASLEPRDTTETFTIQCLILAWKGTNDFKAARDRAEFILQTIRDGVLDDPTLGGAVSRAELFTMRLVNWQMEKGVEVYIQFGIRATVF